MVEGRDRPGTVSSKFTVLLLPELKSLANMARLLQKKDVISALASF
jgi:hypothetical protein